MVCPLSQLLDGLERQPLDGRADRGRGGAAAATCRSGGRNKEPGRLGHNGSQGDVEITGGQWAA